MRSITVEEFVKEEFDYILDVRSPREFNESHIPGSVNFYVLNNEQHHYIGNIYTNVSKFKAKKEGVVFMLENISRQLCDFNAEPGSKIAVYCARGGNRSTALWTILSQLDYRVYKIIGGYKAYRKWVVNYLKTFEHKKFLVLRGNSGCGKTELLEYLKPSLDLEKLANHFGSSFGCRGKQPSQKQFENNIAGFLSKTDPGKIIFIEAESHKIGDLFVPNLLFRRMQASKQIEITADLDERIKRILNYYGSIDNAKFEENLNRIKKYISKETFMKLKEHYEKKELEKVAEILLTQYYDKVYKKKKADFTVKNDSLQAAVKEIELIAESIV